MHINFSEIFFIGLAALWIIKPKNKFRKTWLNQFKQLFLIAEEIKPTTVSQTNRYDIFSPPLMNKLRAKKFLHEVKE